MHGVEPIEKVRFRVHNNYLLDTIVDSVDKQRKRLVRNGLEMTRYFPLDFQVNCGILTAR